MNNTNLVTAVLGCQWGDEGKGKLIDILSPKYDLIVRAAGGANAGHTVYIKDPHNPEKVNKFISHLIPSGMLNDHTTCVIGNGLVLHLETLFEEIEYLEENGISTEGRILISDRVQVLFDYHKLIDGIQEERKGKKKVGTTMRGIGPCYADKIRRTGIRMHEMLDFEKFKERYHENIKMLREMYGDFEYNAEEEIDKHQKMMEKVRPMVIEGAYYLNKAIKEGKNILIEGANGAMLDIDHGTYPYVTSSNSTVGGLITGTGVTPSKLGTCIGILKAYTTRVGAGPFPSELLDDLGEKIREAGGEYGSTTGRPRRCGWFDAMVSKYAVMLNDIKEVNLTKLDVLTGLTSIKIAIGYKYEGKSLDSMPASLDIMENVEVEYMEMPGWEEDIGKIKNYEDLPANAKAYVEKIEELIECKITYIGVGVEREDMILK